MYQTMKNWILMYQMKKKTGYWLAKLWMYQTNKNPDIIVPN